jgi:GT2 family glycosyltransferase
MTPFLTIITPTYRRPEALVRCMASVQAQSAVEAIEHLIIPDYVGRGIPGMFRTLARYAAAVHGQYVYVMGDDDVLVGPTVVQQVREAAIDEGQPPVLLVRATGGEDRDAEALRMSMR